MSRVTSLVAYLISSSSLLAQVGYNQFHSKINYDSAIVSSIRKFDFNWSLEPAGQVLLNNSFNKMNAREWKSATIHLDELVKENSSFLPAYYYRFVCLNKGNNSLNQLKLEDFKRFYGRLPKATNDIYFDLWDALIPNTFFERRINQVFETAPPFYYLSQYLIQHESNLDSVSSIYLKKAYSYLLVGELYAAVIFTNISQYYENSASSLYLKATAYQLQEQYDSSALLYSKLLKQDPTVLEAHENLALYKAIIEDRSGSLGHLTAINQLEPENPRVWYFSGHLKSKLQDYTGALLDLTKYLKKDPNDFTSLKQRAIIHFTNKNYHGSLKDLNQAIKIFENDIDIHIYLSENYFLLGDISHCLKVLRNARNIFLLDPKIDLYTADKLVEVNKLNQAQEIINHVIRFVEVNGTSDEYYLHSANFIQAKIYLKKDKLDKAFQIINDLILKKGEQIDYIFFRVKVFLAQGEKSKAMVDLEKLIKAGHQPAMELFKSL